MDCDGVKSGTVKRAKECMVKRAIEGATVIESPHEPTITETAYHEAGHAVVAVLLKLPFKRVTIVPCRDQELLGRLELDGRPEDGRKPSRELVERLVLDVSGPIAAIIWGEKRRGASLQNLSEILEVQGICEKLRHLMPEKVDADALVKVLDYSKKILDLHWTEVRLIANALLKERTLSKQRVLSLLEV